MSSRLRRLVLTLLIVYLAGMLAAFCWINFGQGLPDEIKGLPDELRPQSSFAVEWLTAETIVLFIQLFMPLHCTAVLLAFSLFPSTGETGGGPAGFARMIRGPLGAFLVLTLGYAFLSESVLPGRQAAGEAARNRAVLATSLYTRGREAEKAGGADPARLAEARLYFINLKRLVPRSAPAQETLDRLEARIKERSAGLAAVAKKAAGSDQPPRPLNQSERDLVARAELYRKQGDYSSVLFYAGLAVKLDGRNLAARKLLEEAGKQLDRYGETPDEQRRRRLSRLKVIAVGSYEEMGRSGRYDPDKVFESYRKFFELAAEFPEDADLRTYLADNRLRLAESHFFFEELPLVADFSASGTGGAFFLNPVALPAGQRELVCFRQLVRTENSGPDGLANGTFLIDLEVMRQDADGALRSHFRVPYARYRAIGEKQESFLQLKCVSRDRPLDPGRIHAPVAVPGSPPAAPPATLMPIDFNEEELGRLAMTAGWSARAGIATLLDGMQLYRRAGYPEGRMQEALLERIARLFNLLVFSFLALALGWKLRSRYLAVPKLAAAASLLLLPPFAYAVLEGWGFVFSLVVGFALHAWGPAAGAAALVALEVFLFAVALLFLAARFNDS